MPKKDRRETRTTPVRERWARRPEVEAWLPGMRLLMSRLPAGWKLVAHRRRLMLVAPCVLVELRKRHPEDVLVADGETVIDLGDVLGA
jgi:hypothetical protein